MDACLDRHCHGLAVAGVVLIVTVNTRSVRMTFERRSFWQGVDQEHDQEMISPDLLVCFTALPKLNHMTGACRAANAIYADSWCSG